MIITKKGGIYGNNRKKELIEIAENVKIAEERGIDLYISAKNAVIKISREGLNVIISTKYNCNVDFVEVMRYSACVFGYLDTAKNIKLLQNKLCKGLI